MSNYTLTEDIKQKWQPVLDHKSMPAIQDNYKRLVTNIVLENQARFASSQGNNGFAPQMMSESAESTAASNITGGTQLGGTSTMANWDPVLVSLVRRSTPNLLAFDVAGVQPMTGPTGLLFAIRAKYLPTGGALSPTSKEALYNEADTAFSGAGTHGGDTSGFTAAQLNTINTALGSTVFAEVDSEAGTGMGVAAGEQLGATGGGLWNEMGFSIEKTSVVAKTRALKAEYTTELAQDLRAIHGLDAEAELANILTTEILAEQNRELIRTINTSAKLGGGTTAGLLDLSIGGDTDGRWFVERFKSLVFQLEIEANRIAKDTRRGRGNFVICSSDVASALSMAGILDYAPAMSTNLTVDDTGNLFAGVINGRIKVYIDPYAGMNYVTVGYRGSNQFDAGIFWAPYVPLEMVRAVGENNFQPKIGFKTRYGIVANPFATITSPVEDNAIGGQSGLGAGTNMYYRKFAVANLI